MSRRLFVRWIGTGLALGLVAVPALAWACPACADHHFRIAYPFVEPVSRTLFWWALVTLLLGLIFDGSIGDAPAPIPTRTMAFAAGAVALAAPCGLGFLMGLNLGLLAAEGFLVLLIAYRIVCSLRVRPLLRSGMLLLLFHGALWTSAAWRGWEAQTHADEPEHLVELLRYEIPDVSEIVLPKLVALGDEAVPALANRGGLRAKDLFRPAAYASFALERICTPKAAALLEDVVVKAPAETSEPVRYARFAFAACSGARATGPLMESFAKIAEPPAQSDLLVALVRSGQRPAVLFALEHLPVLTATAKSWEASGVRAKEALQALESAKSPQDLRSIRAYSKHSQYASAKPATGYLGEFYDTASRNEPSGAGAEVLREKWTAIFAAPAPGEP